MNLSKVQNDLNQLSPFEQYRIMVMIQQQLGSPENIQRIKKHLKPNQEITYFDESENRLIEAIVIRLKEKRFVLEVVDDGDGFKDTRRVFELFSQSQEDNMTRTAQGMGVGLYIVKKLCDIMTYKIDLASSKIWAVQES